MGTICRKIRDRVRPERDDDEPAADDELVLGPGTIVLIGEMHGTHEVPAFVADLVDELAGPVTVGLELPAALQPGIDALLAGAGRGALLAIDSDFWTYRDGRGGEALIVLLERLRDRGDVNGVCFDGEWPDAEARDRGMAERWLAAIDRAPEAVHVGVCGNLHARSDAPRWMGWHVRARHPDLIALDARFDGGAIWAITDDGPGIHAIGAPTGDVRRGLVLYDRRDERGYDGELHLGPATPSLPIERAAR